MNEITLISNSGIQFYNFKITIDPLDHGNDVFRFVEDIDVKRFDWWLDEVCSPGKSNHSFYSKHQLIKSGVLNKYGHFNDDVFNSNISDFVSYELDQINEVKNPIRTIDKFTEQWIPLPYFKKNNINPNIFGPLDWARIFMKKVDSNTFQCSLVFDTTATENLDDQVSPQIHENPNENKFDLCSESDLVLSFLDPVKGCDWLTEYLKRIVKKSDGMANTIHLALYVHLIRVLNSTQKFPSVQLVSDRSGAIDVDLIVDIGNSNTCALLFENPNDENFNFNKVKQLTIRDLSNPLESYSESFSTKLIFKDLEFGNNNIELTKNQKFQWPSPVRIGNEAQRLVNSTNVELALNRDTQFYNSSPKRYLWDQSASKLEWEFQPLEMNQPPKKVYKKGVSEQLTSKGELCEGGIFGRSPSYSKKSLMTFIYLEIFSQAICQINSVEFRSNHGNPSYRRRLRRIVISCPTAMIKSEQYQLRKCAEDAIQILKNYNAIVFSSKAKVNSFLGDIDVIPSVRDFKLPDSNNESKKDWIYDEATVSQLLFMYSQIQHKFDGDAEHFFNLYGRNGDFSNRKLRVGSIDIGGGTSDFLVSEYGYSSSETTEISPEPLYWESFHYAGDDLLQQIIQQIVIEGTPKSQMEKGCVGVIEQHGRDLGIADIHERLNGFFGADSMKIGYRGKLMRVNFINQIGIPLALEYMKIANFSEQSAIIEKDFTAIFHDRMPNGELLRYFERHFGFRFEELIWRFNPKVVNDIIDRTFSRLVNQVSRLIHTYNCDIILLSGKPCAFKSLEKLFSKQSALPVNRLFNLNHYWIGRWYPFADNNGYISDPKTVICMGSLISLLGGSLFKLDRFRINTNQLKLKFNSTANYIGQIIDFQITNVVLTPTVSEGSFLIHDLPIQLGYRRVNSTQYPGSNLATISFDNNKISEIVSRRLNQQNNEAQRIADLVEDYKSNLKRQLPFKITLERDFEESRESLRIVAIQSNEGDDIQLGALQIQQQTLSKSEGYWLDNGEFKLSISI